MNGKINTSAAAAPKKKSIWDSHFLDSKIHSANTEKKEGIWGYFVGPCFVYMAYYAIAGSYLTQFYTDVIGIGGIFMTLMPIFSKVFDAITNIIMGRIIDRTHTRQGKARPWLLLSGLCMAIAGCLLYAVPRAGYRVQIVWIIFSYNLYFAFAFTMYNMSHSLMVPLSTRNTKQRDSLAMLTSTGTTMLPGLLTTIVLPIMINAFGVGSGAQGTWLMMMSLLSIIAFPAVIIEYYFTKERVTEDSTDENGESKTEAVPLGQQVKACFHDKYWVMIIGFWAIYNLFNQLSTGSILYYSNWVLSNSVKTGTINQVLVNAIGQMPLGFGIFALWPLVRKYGKRRVSIIGYLIGAVGCFLVILFPKSLPAVLCGLFVKSIGALPTYLNMAFLAEALDHIEYKYGFRADGFSASAMSIAVTLMAGVAQSIILGGVSTMGYIAPKSTSQVINQPMGMQIFFLMCFVGAPMVGYVIGSFIFGKYTISDHMDEIQADIVARRKAEAEARGEVYISPEEKEKEEQERLDVEAEEKRIEELKALCAKKGLDFDDEEARYQEKKREEEKKAEEKLAKKTAKENARKAKRAKKRQ